MALIHRFSRLLSADLHAVLDRLEDPAVLLQQAQREMTEALASERTQLQRTERSLDQVDRALQQVNKQLAALGEELDLCFEAGDEALARSVIKRRLQQSAELANLTEQHAVLKQQRAQLQERVEAHQRDLDTIASEAERLADLPLRHPASAPKSAGNSISEEAIELALLAERRARGART